MLDFTATGVRISATAAMTGAAGAVIATVGAMIAAVGATVATVGATIAAEGTTTVLIEGGVVMVVVELTEQVKVADDPQSRDDVEGTTMGESRVETADVREVAVIEDATKLVEPVVAVRRAETEGGPASVWSSSSSTFPFSLGVNRSQRFNGSRFRCDTEGQCHTLHEQITFREIWIPISHAKHSAASCRSPL